MNREEALQAASDIARLVYESAMALNETLPDMIANSVYEANGNAGKVRKIARAIATAGVFLPGYRWMVGLTTEPGDIVSYNEKLYIFSSDTSMTHTNPLFHPGADGVYYWTLIPEMKDGYRVYPDTPYNTVAVKKGDIWWNSAMTERYEFIGEDNDNCVWAPDDESNLWKPIEEEKVHAKQ